MSSNTINLTVLDPDSYKQSLITFLQTKPQYSGYNFEGSNWNVLLDVLARNTFLRSFFTNMAFSEGFLDSAQIRDNAVSRAKELNYIPFSMSSSTTTIDLTINTNSLTSFTIPFGTRFQGVNSNGSFVFTTDDVIFQTSSSGSYSFPSIEIFEGTYITDLFNVDTSIENQLFTLSNPTIDISSITVQVTENFGANTNIYPQATDIFGLTSNSQVYYLQGASNNNYQICFGDGVLSYQPQDGAIVTVTYRVTSGPAADGISSFNLIDNLGALNGGTITSINIASSNVSSGGANAESIGSIKLNAPRIFQTQERGVTDSDYKTLIMREFPQIGDLNVYGGGITANAILFGTVIIAAVSKSGNPLTQTLKNQILNYIEPIDVIHPFTNIVDPDYIFLDVSSNVHIDFSLTSNTASWYQSQIANTINNFSFNSLQKFNTPFRYSKLGEAIDEVDNTAILSNETTITMKKSISLMINTNTNISFSFDNPIANIISDNFVSNGVTSYITDTVNNVANGILFTVFLNNNSNVISYTPVGTVNYSNGYISISNLFVSAATVNTSFYIYAKPQNKDIYALQNDIIEIDTVNGLTINISNN